jgi:hypothetical protein
MVNCDYRNSLALVAEAQEGCTTSIAAITHIIPRRRGCRRNACEFAVTGSQPAMAERRPGNLPPQAHGGHRRGARVPRVLRAYVWERQCQDAQVFDKIDRPMRASVDCRVVRLDYELNPFPADMDERLPGASGRRRYQCVFTENHPLMVYARNPLRPAG